MREGTARTPGSRRCGPPRSTARESGDANACAGSWQLAHASVPEADKRGIEEERPAERGQRRGRRDLFERIRVERRIVVGRCSARSRRDHALRAAGRAEQQRGAVKRRAAPHGSVNRGRRRRSRRRH